jgi:DNA modification methylase
MWKNESMSKPAEVIAELFDPPQHLPKCLGEILDHQTELPRIAKDARLIADIEAKLEQLPARHDLYRADSRAMEFLAPGSIHLVVTSPPYWNLKNYNMSEGQLGYISNYDKFLDELDRVWKTCFNGLVPGGRLICVVGDVCISRRKNKGEHLVMPLHASIQERCRKLGFNNLAPIIWHKIANAIYEATGNGGGFLGKPYEPNAVIKNDIEFILMERKPGGYRSPSLATRILSVIPADQHKAWFQQIWTGITGASTKDHPAPYPIQLAERLIRMFSFVGERLVRDRLYDAACFFTSNADSGRRGQYSEPNNELSIRNFAISLQARAAAFAQAGNELKVLEAKDSEHT